MTYKVDLGQCLCSAPGAHLQLHFSAVAHFTQSNYINRPEWPIQSGQWPNPQAIWVTEAPELELRLFVGIDLRLQVVGATFVANLGDKLCNSSVC